MNRFRPNAMLIGATFRALFYYSELLSMVLTEANSFGAIPQEVIARWAKKNRQMPPLPAIIGRTIISE